MATPRCKKSKSKKQMRKRSHSREIIETRPCPQCGAHQQPHRVCGSCGYYAGRQVLTIKADD